MQYAKSNSTDHIIRLDPDDQIIESVEQFCVDSGIKNAAVWGIGSVDSPTLGHYRVDSKKFSEKPLEGIFEISSLQGNVSWFEGQPMAHIHVVVSDESMQAFGGHLVAGRCSATVELLLRDLGSDYAKKPVANIGLNLWDFSS